MLEIVFVTATGTGVGKTWTTSETAKALMKRGIPVAIRKPVQSFDPEVDEPDANVLAEACGLPPDEICPPHRTFPLALAPPLAAAELGMAPFTTSQLQAEMALPPSGIVLVEGVGGVRSPLAVDGDNIAFADELGATSIVLVADAGLGAINAVRLCVDALAPRPCLVFLNRFDPAARVHQLNHAWLRGLGIQAITDIDDLAARLSAGFPG